MWAVVETGGKQYRLQPGDKVRVEKLNSSVGERLELDRVLVAAREGEVEVGSPVIPGARVVVEVLDQGKGKKIRGFKYKNKTNYRRRYGHRQLFTLIGVEEIVW